MKKIISILLAAVLMFSFSFSAFAAAVHRDTANATRNAAKETFDNLKNTKFDVDGSGSITAADARATLLRSAGLSQTDVNESKMDTDGDGKVTAIDARVILRLSAGLESIGSYLSASEKLDYFNAILNTAIPNKYQLYKNGIEYTADVTYTDPNGVISALDNAFSSIDDSVSFKDALVGGKGEKVYSGNTAVANYNLASNRMMVIYNADGVDEDQSSYLTVDDITGVEYKTNQTYTFTRYGTDSDGQIDYSNMIYTQSVTGLDSLTVYLKSDNNVTGEHSAKAFTVYDQATLEKEVSKVSEQFNNMSMEFSALYSMQFNVTPSVGDVKYHDGYITIYFYPDSGNIVSAYYSLYTDYTMGLYMDVDIFMALPYISVDKAGQVNITNSTQSIKEFYFYTNNPNHVKW